jgi:glycosyltransferase involved in cell wall biosynthesis
VARPRISIVTPTLNAERYVEECLGSIQAQEYPGLEHFVVDGGSRDRTEQLVLRAGAAWVSRPGLKQAAAINAGLRLATGDVVTWLNADDLYTPGSLACVAERFEADPTLDMLYGDCDVIGASGRLLWRERPGPYDFDRLLGRGNYLAQPAVFLRREILDEIGLLDESLEFGMDYDLWLRLRHARIEYVPRVLAAFRWHAVSKTALNTRANWRELLIIVRRYQGGWTPYLVWSFMRAHLTLARQRVGDRLR